MPQDVGKLIVDLGAVASNYNFLQSKVGQGARVACVLKANGYGLGAEQIAETLYKAGCRDFFVAKPSESIPLSFLSDDAKVYVLNGFYETKGDLYVQHDLIPVIGSFSEIEELRKFCQAKGVSLPCYLKFNTGMHRLGFASIEQEELVAQKGLLKDINVLGVMSHIACADQPDHEKNQDQLARFQKIAEHFPDAEKSFANSSGVFLGDDYHYDVVRAGASLYGVNPTPHLENPMKPIVKLDLPIIRTRYIDEGASVGYNASWTSRSGSFIATVGAGYADGIFRCLSNKGKLYWKGYACPIIGKISMDLTTVDLSAIPENERPRFGDFLQLIGEEQTVDDLANDAGTIGYEVLTTLGQRYERVYVDQPKIASIVSTTS